MNNIWYHGTPDVRELQEEGGFTQRYIDIDYVDDIDGWKSTQDAMKLARESGNDEEYFELLKKAGTFRKKAKIRKPVFLTNVYSVAKTYADPQRAFDYQNSIEKVLKVKTKEGGKGVTISAPGSRFRFIDINNVKRGFLDAGVDVNDLDLAIEKLNFAVGVDSGIKTNSIAALADWLGFDYVDVVGVLDSYHGGSTKSTVRMVMDPNNIDIVRDGINESLRGFIRGIIRESLGDNISNSKIAYHVSPFKFDKFDFSKVGSREMAHIKKAKDVGMFFSQDEWSIDWMKNIISRDGSTAYVYKCKLNYKNPYTLDDFYTMIDDWAGEGYGRRLVNRVGYWNAYDRHTDDILDDALSGGYDSIVFGDFIVVFEGVKIDILDVEESEAE